MNKNTVSNIFIIPLHFQAAKVPVKEYEFDQKKLANVQSHLVKQASSLFMILDCY